MIKYIHEAMAKKREMLAKDEKGFTLIELLVVVLILGILAAIAIPVFIGQQGQAEEAAAESNLANAKVAYVSYLIENHAGIAQGSVATAPTVLNDLGWPVGEPTVSLVVGGEDFCLQATANGKTFATTKSTAVGEGTCTVPTP